MTCFGFPPAIWCRLTDGDRIARPRRSAVDVHGRVIVGRQARVGLSRSAGETGPERRLVFLGTSVVSGTATAVAVVTGPTTFFGDIRTSGDSCAGNRVRARPAPVRPADRSDDGRAALFIVLVGVALKHDPFESLLFAVALGVGLTPESLRMIASITLTRGALRMAREQVIVKHLPAIQNFGSIHVRCSDKTGTLTAGVMQLDRAVDPTGVESSRPLTLAHLNSQFETGIRSPLDAAILQHTRSTSPPIGRSTKSLSTSTAAASRSSSNRPGTEHGGCSLPRARRKASWRWPVHSKLRAMSNPSTRRRGRLRRRPQAPERRRPARARHRVPVGGIPAGVLARRRDRPRARRVRQLRGSRLAGCGRRPGRSRTGRREGQDPYRRQ